MGRIGQIRRQIGNAMPEFLALLRRDLPHFVYRPDPITNEIPVFSFHEVTSSMLEALLGHMSRNGYVTVGMDDLLDHLSGSVEPRPNRVVLTFDDGLSSAWTVATPLLKRYGMRATLYIAPAMLTESAGRRLTIDGGMTDEAAAAEDGRLENYLITWDELDGMLESGVWDIQSHTMSHARIWTSDRPSQFVCPETFDEPHYVRRWKFLTEEGERTITVADMPFGAPIYANAPRMTNAARFIPDPDEGPALARFVSGSGGEEFFAGKDWKGILEKQLAENRRSHPGRWETDAERYNSLETELATSRQAIESRTGKEVRHLLFPWEKGSDEAIRAARSAGFRSACWGTLRKRRSNYAGDDPFRIPRVSWKFIPLLPGEGRRSLMTELCQRVITRVGTMVRHSG